MPVLLPTSVPPAVGGGALLGGPLTLSLLCTITHPSPTTQDPSFFSTNLNATT